MHHKSKSFNHIYGEIIKKFSYERPLKEAHDMAQAFEVVGNNEMFINFIRTKVWNYKEIIINDVFVFIVITNIINYHDLQTIDECLLRYD